ncbi:MAG: 2-oxoacid:acceptor oxidoreductase family protein [Chloroflexi bacterium]|nr:2-oxoacid:acceptor oxidoreductase family protein [Chloroflexota bacterium]
MRRNMIEIRWHARAGQGAVTAAKALADAALAEGKFIQAFPDYGPERMGAPVKAYNRVSETPIRTHGIVEHPKVIVIVDPSLVGSEVTEGAPDDAVFLVNSTKSPSEAQKALGAKRRVFTVDATRIAQEAIGLRKPNTPMLGAVAKVTGVIQLDTLLAQTEKSFGHKYKREVVEGNLAAIRRAYEEVRGEM